MKHLPRVAIIATSIAVAAVWVYRFKAGSAAPALDPTQYAARPSSLTLTGEQRRELIDPGPQGISVYRFQSTDGFWQVGLTSAQNSGPSGAFALGTLFAVTHPPQITTPVYRCVYAGFGGRTTSLDLSPRCSGEGQADPPEPVGYLSAALRTGYRMIVRCRDARHGFYLSLNPRCESAQDRLQLALGSIRATQ